MKKKLLGLGVCALALGAFAGAVSAQRALETRAADDNKNWELVGVIGGEEYWGDCFAHEDDDNLIVAQLAKDDVIKLRYGTTWDITVGGDVLGALKTQIGGEDSNTYFVDDSEHNHNAIVQKSGYYAFNLPSNYAEYGDKTYGLTVTFLAEATYTAKLGDDNLALSSIEPGAKNMIKQYEATVTADKGTELTVYAGGEKITSQIGADDGSSFDYTESGIFTAHNNLSSQKVYVKIWADGGVSVYGAGRVEYTGYYLISASGSWAPENGIASNGAHGDNVATFINVSLEANEEFTVAKFTDSVRDSAPSAWETDSGWSNVDSEHSDAYAKFGAGASNNHVKVKTAGTFCVYVHADKAMFINNYQVTQDDYDAVDAFVAEYITEQAKPETGAGTCEAKYTAAAAALAALNEVRQDLFWNDDKYESARAAFEYWRDHRQGNTIYHVEGMNNNVNTGLVITLIAVGAAAVIGGSIFFAARKRKQK